MEKSKVSEYLNNIEEFETYNIIRFLAFVIYLEFALRYFFKTNFLNFAASTALYEFVFANWLTLIFIWLVYHPVQNIGNQTCRAIKYLLFDVFYKLREAERKDYEGMKKEGFIIDIKIADEIVRIHSDKKLEREVEQVVEARRKEGIVKMRLGIIFALLLINAVLFWFEFSSVGLILKTNLFQIFALLVLTVWIACPASESYDYVCAPRYLTPEGIKEIENDNFFSRKRKRHEKTSAAQENAITNAW